MTSLQFIRGGQQLYLLSKATVKRLNRIERYLIDINETIDKKGIGVKGHQGHFRELLAVEEVDKVVSCKLPKRCVCGEQKITNQNVLRHHVYELPPIKLNITDYQLEKGTCVLLWQETAGLLTKRHYMGYNRSPINEFYVPHVLKIQVVSSKSAIMFK